MRRILNVIGGAVLTIAFAFLLAFSFLNFLMGCESWDESYWTETNSCITVTQLLEGITND